MGITTVPHPRYCQDLAPCDFWLFPKLRGCRYETIEEMKEAVTKVIDMLTQDYFDGALQKLLERYNKDIAAKGGFKGVQEEIPSEVASKTVLHPRNSPDLAPCDFWLFPKLRGCRYEIIEEMKEAVTKVIDTFKQENFHGAFQKLLGRLLRRGLGFHECTINKTAHTIKSLETYLMMLVYLIKNYMYLIGLSLEKTHERTLYIYIYIYIFK